MGSGELFGTGLWGGIAGGVPSNVGVPLWTIIQRAYRIAGITKWVGTTPQDDWFTEAIAEMNAMIGTLNLSRLNIFTISINAFNIGSGQKVFTIGPGADFDMPRPQSIENGVIGLGPVGSNNLVRMPPMYQMNDQEWALISLQDIPNGVPLSFYYDGSFDPETGWALIYLWTQTTMSYSVEWYCWQAIPTFITKNDQVALPPNYPDLFVYSLAERLANLNPLQQHMTAESREQARKCRAALQSYNAPSPRPFVNDAATVGSSRQEGIGHFDYRIGSTRWW